MGLDRLAGVDIIHQRQSAAVYNESTMAQSIPSMYPAIMHVILSTKSSSEYSNQQGAATTTRFRPAATG
jgi:hypothetical protein